MGATDPKDMAPGISKLVDLLQNDNVTAVLLVPV